MNVGPLAQWREILLQLTADSEAARNWRQERYRFAHRLGDALAGDTRLGAAVRGPVLYGVWLNWGLLYIGQTQDGARRLKDLPVGESHHLAATFPPEIWTRVVVLEWARIAGAAALFDQLTPQVVGLALEHRLQTRFQPLSNSQRRTPDGGWRDVVWDNRRSRGARAREQVNLLYEAVEQLWTEASDLESGDSPSPLCRVVFPQDLVGT